MVSATEPAKDKVAITNVRVFDGKQFSEPRTVVIEGGRIGEDDEGAEIIDGLGGFLLPGLIDAHVHLQNEQDLRQMVEYGITSALDMATWPPSKLTPLRGRVGLTDIRSPGLAATSPGSIHSHVLPMPKEELVTNPEDAVRFVTKRVSEGVDYIKVISDVPGPDQQTLNALVSCTHEHNLLAIAHASSFTPFAMAQDAQADILTHVPLDQALDDEAVARMIAANRISVPTLTMMEGTSKPPPVSALLRLLLNPSAFLAIVKSRRSNPHSGGRKYENARDSVTAMYRAGVPILAGTDANSEPGSPFPVIHGESLHHELELLVEAGLSTVDALRAATELPAKYFGLGDRGVIEVGMRADLILLTQDPLLDIRATRSIQHIWCGGVKVQKSAQLV